MCMYGYICVYIDIDIFPSQNLMIGVLFELVFGKRRVTHACVCVNE